MKLFSHSKVSGKTTFFNKLEAVNLTFVKSDIFRSLSSIYNKAFLRKSITSAWKVSVFGVILVRIFPHSDWIQYSVRMRENADQNNSEYGYLSRRWRWMGLFRWSREVCIFDIPIVIIHDAINIKKMTSLKNFYVNSVGLT